MLPYEMNSSPDPLHQSIVTNTPAVSHRVVHAVFNDQLTLRDVEGLQERLDTQGRLAVDLDGAEALVLGCTAMLGCWRKLKQAVDVPVIDPTVAALNAACSSAQLKREYGWGASTKRAGSVPSNEELEIIASFEKTYPYSGRIEIE